MSRDVDDVDNGRRQFLAASVLIASFSILPSTRASAQHIIADEGAAVYIRKEVQDLAGSLKTNPLLDAWIRIDAQNIVTVYTGKVELGTGVRTALLQIASEELHISPHLVNFLTADTHRSPDEGLTAGSHTIADSGSALLNAAAQVRELLVATAASRMRVEPTHLAVKDAKITAPDGREMLFSEIVPFVDLHRIAAPASPLSDPRTYNVIGAPLQRVDIPGKVTGGRSYIQDVQLPRMAHARVVLPPAYDALLIALDEQKVRTLPGVVKVVRDGSMLAVVGADEWQAILAQRALAGASTWTAGRKLPDPRTVHDELKTLATERIAIAGGSDPGEHTGDVVAARYTKRYLMHGSIGPSCAVALLDNNRITVWTHSQGVYPLRNALAEMLAMPRQAVRCVHVEGSGCYGHNGADDVAAHAALIARAVPGRPVRVQWMRDQEHLWEPYPPAMVTEVRASLSADGRIAAWDYALWSSSHNERIVNAGRLMPARQLARPFFSAPSVPMVQPEGGGDRNAIPLYALPNLRVMNNFSPTMPLRTSAMRGLGAHMNIFSIESFMDELAAVARVDPVQFRVNHLSDSRAIDVVQRAAREFGWPTRPARGRGIGFAFAKYKNLMAYVALAVEISVELSTGEVRLVRAVAAVDTGQIVNPDGVRNQIEGGILQSASCTLYEELLYDTERLRSFDWSSYPIMRFSNVPDSVAVHLIDRPGTAFLGVAEAAMGPTAGAIANAIFNATGKRLRDLPLSGARLLQHLNA